MKPPALLRHSRWDAILALLALLQGALLCVRPSLLLVALGLWWCSNTVAHYFLHKPFFRAAWLNRSFALYLTALLGVPQSLWRERHLAHHADRPWRLRVTRELTIETALVLAVWMALGILAPDFLLRAYLPGYVLGLGLCALHGWYEHARGTTSHYGRPYNWLFFNDGYHVEHHERPGLHWRQLPQHRATRADASSWPAVLRWLDAVSLDNLERLALQFASVQRFLIARHEAAFRRLLGTGAQLERIAIVGGGLFPRTAIVLRRLFPRARLVVIDRSAAHLEIARSRVEGVALLHATYSPLEHTGFDLVVVPLAFVGDREALYRDPPAPRLVVHDWLWRPRGRSAIVSLLLCKRLNLLHGAPLPAAPRRSRPARVVPAGAAA